MAATVAVYVWHDSEGNITAVGRPAPSARGRIVPVAGLGRAVTPVEVAEQDIATLHRTHEIDVKQRTLRLRR